ncbi:hypothetical protein [Frankia sp. AvcI1]|nr:hypothetical protein [Frankia sp. AvcI1]
MTLDRTEATRLFEQSYRALMSYRYLGKDNPHLDRGATRETMPLRTDMRNSAGGIMAAPLCVLAVEPWWLDYQGVAAMVAPVTMTYSMLDAMGFSRSVVVDADDPERLIAITTGSGFDLGVVPDGFEPIDNPVDEFDDDTILPPLYEAFGGHLDDDGSVVIAELSPALGAPTRSLHQAPINIIAEAAATAALPMRRPRRWPGRRCPGEVDAGRRGILGSCRPSTRPWAAARVCSGWRRRGIGG